MPRASGSRSARSRTVRPRTQRRVLPSLDALETRATISDAFVSTLVVPGLAAAALDQMAPPPPF